MSDLSVSEDLRRDEDTDTAMAAGLIKPLYSGRLLSPGLAVDVIVVVAEPLEDEETAGADEVDELAGPGWLRAGHCVLGVYTRSRPLGTPATARGWVYWTQTLALPRDPDASTIEVLAVADGCDASDAPVNLSEAGWARVEHPGFDVFSRAVSPSIAIRD